MSPDQPANRPWSEPLTPPPPAGTPAGTEPAAPVPGPVEPTPAELAGRLRSLSAALQILLAVTIVTIGVVNVMLLQQIRGLRRAALQMQENAVQMRAAIADYSTNTAPMLQRFYIDLKGLAGRNPDYAAIFSRYPNVATSDAPQAAVPPSPSPTSAPPAAPAAPRR
jgi:hypothetical protein